VRGLFRIADAFERLNGRVDGRLEHHFTLFGGAGYRAADPTAFAERSVHPQQCGLSVGRRLLYRTVCCEQFLNLIVCGTSVRDDCPSSWPRGYHREASRLAVGKSILFYGEERHSSTLASSTDTVYTPANGIHSQSVSNSYQFPVEGPVAR